ncbi:Monoacylglycerol lipase ABHD6 [Hondaea fermentalgiana]|uniref:Monoacylglycerol lipase ABHD6 n=1 Tax=Hondaea fermentalgiana TaxID=2315210 RepID=A0A2R5G9B6_9STRA|nr:Monoacylglycerol lipase ABHD6 [Hondaea fermentalgiana]|eukprot:GBG25073.1 Monoacylglycerol lipase ABHD6 [Hondaea fermentalgiana]
MIDLDEVFFGVVRAALVVIAFVLWRSSKRRAYVADGGAVATRQTANPPEGGKVQQLTRGHCHYRIDGEKNSGKLVVLVHGLIGCTLDYGPLCKILVEQHRRRVLRLDLYGRGWSTAPLMGADSLPELYAGQIAELLFAIGERGPIDLVGNSMGGAIAACFAARFGRAHVASVTLVVPAGLSAVDKTIPAWQQRLYDVLEELPFVPKHLLRANVQARLDKLKDEQYSHWTVPNNDVIRKYYHDYQAKRLARERYLADAYIETLRSFPLSASKPLFEALARSEVPCMVCWSKLDRRVPFACAEEMRAIFAGADFEEHISEDGGHSLVIENAPFVAERFVPFSRKN